MTIKNRSELERRVLFCLPPGGSAEHQARLEIIAGLEALGVSCLNVRDLGDALAEIKRGVGIFILSDVALANGRADDLLTELRQQSRWSQLAVILAESNLPHDSTVTPADSWCREYENTIRVPLQSGLATWTTWVMALLRDRERQYKLRDLLLLEHRELPPPPPQEQPISKHASAKERCASAGQVEQLTSRHFMFLSRIAHEIRNPLAPMRNALQLLRLSGEIGPTLEFATGLLERQVTQLVKLCEELSDAGRLGRGGLEIEARPLDLAIAVRSATSQYIALHESLGHTIQVVAPKVPVTVLADSQRLNQVLGILLKNAMQHSRPGTVIEVSATSDGDWGKVSVRDQGKGMEPATLKALFDILPAVETSSAAGGLGAGLWIAKRLVELGGGKLEAASEGLDKGSEFSVFFPLAHVGAAAQPVPQVPMDHNHPLPRREVVIVDDTRGSEHVLRRLLEILGQSVRSFDNAKQAFQSARETPPDLIISDIAMPDIDGYEFARMIRAEPRLQRVPLIALTGYEAQADIDRARAAGFSRHLSKPISIETLNALLSSVI